MSAFSHSANSALAGLANATDSLAVTLLRRCFSDEEWEHLIRNQEFNDALGDVQGLDQVERLVQFGADILLFEWWKELTGNSTTGEQW
jgi:hypothetical protein